MGFFAAKTVLEYKGHKVYRDRENYGDCYKYEYTVQCPDGVKRYPDVSPYRDVSEEICLWIDKGYPKRVGIGPLTVEELNAL